jgi:ATP-dependent RNA helicase DDX56/DBP9
MIVVDEADLVFSFGYEKDIEKIVKYLPKICQGFLASATLGAAVESLKKLILHTPVVLKLEEEKDKRLLLQQYIVKNSHWNEKFLQLYVLLKLKVISGKTIVFVNSIEGCYRLKLFLERLSIKSAVLNSELPQNSRYHIVQEFNKGLFSILIATDEANKGEADDSDSEDSNESGSESDSDSEQNNQEASSSDEEDSESEVETKKKSKSKASSKESTSKQNGKKTKNKKQVSSSSSSSSSSSDEEGSEDEVGSFSGESFDGMDVDEDLEDVDDLDMGSVSDDSDNEGGSDEDDEEDQTFESAKKEAEEAIGEIDGYKSVTKNALKVMQERLAAMTKAQEREDAESAAKNDSGSSTQSTHPGKKNGLGSKADAEYGVSRGVDFRGIQTVVNFDFPRSSRAYTHRVGRTARAGQAGTSLSFTTPKDDEIFQKVSADQTSQGLEIKPYIFNQAAIDSFRYRIEGVLRTVTDLSIREARYEEIRREVLGSQKLQTFFEENPREMELLKHDKSLLEKKINPRLRVVPDYIMTPQTSKEMQPLVDRDYDEEFLEHYGARRKGFGKRRLNSDPLKTFSPSAKKHKGADGTASSRGRGGKRGGRGGRRGRPRHVGLGSGFGPGT